MFLPALARGGGAVIRDGGVKSNSIGEAHDPSAPAGHLPGFAREEGLRRSLSKRDQASRSSPPEG
ncbi:hypothetical protein BH10PSE6_BH10PSE6_17340 [soil metagenome]